MIWSSLRFYSSISSEGGGNHNGYQKIFRPRFETALPKYKPEMLPLQPIWPSA